MHTTLTSADSVAPPVPAVGSSDEPMKAAAGSEPPAIDPLPALSGKVESAPPTIPVELPPTNVALVEVGADPIAHAPSSPAPMPWDQVEEVAVVIPPASPESGIDGFPKWLRLPLNLKSGPAVTVEAVLPSMELPAETGSHRQWLLRPLTPAPLPWEPGCRGDHRDTAGYE